MVVMAAAVHTRRQTLLELLGLFTVLHCERVKVSFASQLELCV